MAFGKSSHPALQVTVRHSFSVGILLVFLAGIASTALADDWYMPGGNPQRTSYMPTGAVTGGLSVRWYRPIEPYITQDVQLVTWGGNVYVSTARGLYCLRASDGTLLWVYATELPLGNAPTIVNGVAYVGGFDRKIHVLNATTGQLQWTWEGAGAGFRGSLLVVNNKIYAGNRDGWMYCIGADGATNEAQVIWQYKAGAAISQGAAYDDGKLYFASMDLYGYCLNADTGALIWKTPKFQYSAGFQSYWPVVWKAKNMVVFCGNTPNYRNNSQPGSQSVGNAGAYHSMEHTAIYGTMADGLIGAAGTQPGDWAVGTYTVDMARGIQYYQQFPHRRAIFIVNASTGQEYTFTYNGQTAYAPIMLWGTKQQSPRMAPAIGPDNVLYEVMHTRKSQSFGRGQVTGWTLGSQYVSLPSPSKHNAWDEPMAFALCGNYIYWNLACDREMGHYQIAPAGGSSQYISYNLNTQAPGYDPMWFAVGSQDGTNNRLWGQYGSGGGIYHNHTATQNPPIPYQGKVFLHRSNCIISFGTSGSRVLLPRANTVPVTDAHQELGTAVLQARLEAEVQKMLNAGNLRIGHFDGGQHWSRTSYGDRLLDYFSNPGDTVWALLRAKPYLPTAMQTQVRTYVQNWQSQFPMQTYAHIGWNSGASREEFAVPPEVQADMNGRGPSTASSCAYYTFPPQMFYCLWKYAQEFGGAASLLSAANSKLDTTPPTDADLVEFCYINNAFIAGYIGYLSLQDMAGQTRNATVQSQLNRLLALRSSTFSPTVPASWQSGSDNSHINRLGVQRNFNYLTPELGAYLRQNVLSTVQQAIVNTDHDAPYWFVTHYEGCLQESTIQNLSDYNAVFQARAWILQEERPQLDKFLDVPAFKVGDLYYIHQLVSLLEAPEPGPEVVAHHIFRNSSLADGNDAAANAADDNAVLAGKAPVLPGQASGGSSISSDAKGVNGIMVDISDAADAAAIAAGDFTFQTSPTGAAGSWVSAPSPASVTVRLGAGPSGSDRVTIIWPDCAIQDCWLRVELRATEHTGLTEPDIFYWGSLRGDANSDGNTNVTDLLRVQQNYLAVNPDLTADVTGDGKVNIFDLLLVRQQYLKQLPSFQAP